MLISKTLLFGLIIVLTLTQAVPPKDESESGDGLTHVSIDNLDPFHEYVDNIILDAILELEDWVLTEVSEITDEESGNRTLYYTYSQVSSENNTEINNSKTVTVVTPDGVTFYIYDDEELVDTVVKAGKYKIT